MDPFIEEMKRYHKEHCIEEFKKDSMGHPGRPTDLTKEKLAKIKQSILDGMNLKEMAQHCEIPETTVYTWSSDNYLGFRDKVEGWKRDRKLNLADKNIEDILELGITEKEHIRVVADMSKFVKETLDKEYYSKRSEVTAKDGKDLPTPIMYVQRDDSNQEDKGTEQ